MRNRIYGAVLVIAYAAAMFFSSYGVYLSLTYLLGTFMVLELFAMASYENLKTPAVGLFSLLFLASVFSSHLGFLISTAGALFLFGYAALVEKEVKNSLFPVLFFFSYILVGTVAVGELDKKYFLLLLSLVWSVDTSAYLIGRCLGRKKLAPSLSPGKTVEGFIGGVLGGTVIPSLLGKFLGIVELSVANLFLLSFLSAVAQIGDLLESFLKRYFGVKDSGNTIPGHGGVLDRLDSTIAVAPFLVVLGGLQ